MTAPHHWTTLDGSSCCTSLAAPKRFWTTTTTTELSTGLGKMRAERQHHEVGQSNWTLHADSLADSLACDDFRFWFVFCLVASPTHGTRSCPCKRLCRSGELASQAKQASYDSLNLTLSYAGLRTPVTQTINHTQQKWKSKKKTLTRTKHPRQLWFSTKYHKQQKILDN